MEEVLFSRNGPPFYLRRYTMDNSENVTLKPAEQTGWQKAKTVLKKIDHIIDIILTVLFRLRKVIMAVPVVYAAVKLARYNMEHLPEYVGVNLQSNGAFADIISRDVAVMGPLALTLACIVLMFFSRKAMYTWAISIFTLALPLLLLLSNMYPA